eukprot:gene8275-17029_t
MASFIRTVSSCEPKSSVKDAYIALGSNIGDRASSILKAFRMLNLLGSVKNTSFLYETPAKYYVDQPSFLNAACLLQTSLSPMNLLKELKNIEDSIGREKNFRYGPRCIDLDILLYDSDALSTSELQIPHPRLHERAFVLQPLMDINPNICHPLLGMSISQLFGLLPPENIAEMKRVIPIANSYREHSKLLEVSKNSKVIIMGILNVTPDSFSDGGSYTSIEDAVLQAKQMVIDGADIIDIGGASSRPGAATVSIEEEIERTTPIIKAIRSSGMDTIISIDTNNSKVAQHAIDAGADIINDISGGNDDENMINIASQYGVPMIFMHMRGTPQTMTTMTEYTDLISDISNELNISLEKASCNGLLPKWLQIVDPGIGFAKSAEQNIALLRADNIRNLRHKLGDRPMLVGASRKGFLGKLTATADPKDRDWATAGASCAAVAGGVQMIRFAGFHKVVLAAQ